MGVWGCEKESKDMYAWAKYFPILSLPNRINSHVDKDIKTPKPGHFTKTDRIGGISYIFLIEFTVAFA